MGCNLFWNQKMKKTITRVSIFDFWAGKDLLPWFHRLYYATITAMCYFWIPLTEQILRSNRLLPTVSGVAWFENFPLDTALESIAIIFRDKSQSMYKGLSPDKPAKKKAGPGLFPPCPNPSKWKFDLWRKEAGQRQWIEYPWSGGFSICRWLKEKRTAVLNELFERLFHGFESSWQKPCSITKWRVINHFWRTSKPETILFPSAIL